MTQAELAQERCAPGRAALQAPDIASLLGLLPGWAQAGNAITKTFNFKNYYETLAFVNALAFIAHATDHHPDLGVHFNRCVVAYSTHDAGGLTRNDFICAARIERLTAT